MMRIAGALLAIVLLLGLGSCPAPLDRMAESGAIEADAPVASAEFPAEAEHPPQADGALPAELEPGVDAALQGPQPEIGPLPPTTAETEQPPAHVGPQPEALEVGPVAPGGQDVNPAAEPGVAPTQPSPEVGPLPPTPQYGALDAENFMGDAPVQTVWGQSKPKLSEDALSFAGRWLVAVVHRQGEARMLDNNAEWVLELGRDGSFYAKQQRGGQLWRQNGTWELSGMKLLLHSGPGGERSYELSQEMDNICVLRDPARETALFCVRDRAGANAAQVQASYDTDFGLLNLRPAGPGHWRGSYGEPAGVLLVAQLGGYLVGTWEQAPSRGFVLLELREGGFAGAWLYGASVSFDGRWIGVAAQ